MNFLSVRLITADIQPLVQFYEQVTGLRATQYTPDFAELLTPTATLAIGSTRMLQAFGGAHVASAAANRSAIIEFRVADVDAEYQRLAYWAMPWCNHPLPCPEATARCYSATPMAT